MPAGTTKLLPERPLGLFEAYGVELEYMIVEWPSLEVSPSADQLLETVAGELTDEWENGAIAWNNELALHVIEFKANGPRASLDGLEADFAANVATANRELERAARRLLPTAMHPWMDPAEVVLWPHGNREVYETFDRIFDCRGHGWSNLQSAHLNLPFADDREFARLAAAIRFLMPILPALTASSPVVDGRPSEWADTRLHVYRENCARFPSVTGRVIPEPVASPAEYHERILEPIYRDLAAEDPEGVLRHEWVNARGAIARFERNTIELRVLDVQECPAVDIAYIATICTLLEALTEEIWADYATLAAWPGEELGALLTAAERTAERTELGSGSYLRALGIRSSVATLHEVWAELIERAAARGRIDAARGRVLEHYLRTGTLATRIRAALPEAPTRTELREVYAELAECLAAGRPFAAHA